MPDIDLTFQKFSELKPLYSRYHMKVRKNRRFYDLDFARDVAMGSGIKPTIPRTARRAIDEAVDHVLTNPKVHVPVRPTNSQLITQQEIAEKKRKACVAWWRQVGQRYNPLGDARKWLFLDGMVAIRHTFRFDLLPDKDDPDYRRKIQALGKMAFMWEEKVLNSEWVYADPSDHRNPQYVYVNYSLTREEAKRKFPNAIPGALGAEWRNGTGDYAKVQYLEGWTAPEFTDDGDYIPGQFRQWIETEMVHDAENPYPYIPIAIEDSGYGLIHEGIDIDERFVGLLDYSYSVLIAQARQWTSMERVAELTAFNPIITRNMSADKAKSIRVGPGEMWMLDGAENDPNREDIEAAKWPDIPLTVLQMIQLTDREVNGSLKTDTLGGAAQTGVDTATEADQNVRNASAKLSGPVSAMERLAVKLTRWFLMDIELGAEAPMTLFGSGPDDPADITLTPREISGYYDVFVQLGTTDEDALSLTRARFWGEMYRVLPFLSAWTAMERGGIADDPLAEMIRRAGEDVFLSEEFRQIRVVTGAQSFGELAAMLAQLAQQNGGAPGKPAAGSPGGGANSADGLVTQDTLTSPVEARVVDESLIDRNTMQAASMMRATRTLGNSNGN